MKPIKVSNQQKEILIRDFVDYINKEVFIDKIQYTAMLDKILDEDVKKPVINITASAYLKMCALVQEYATEVGWHGCVHKEQNVYTIYDIIVYPQTATSTRVTTDDKTYGEWLIKELEDDTFNHLRFQGHSHAHMATNPSGVDDHMYESILRTLQEGDYYIFAILNKTGELNIWIYDYTQNVIFEKKDITVNILLDGDCFLNDWLTTEIKKVEIATPTVKTYASSYYSNYPNNYASYVDDVPPTLIKKSKTKNEVKGGKRIGYK